MPACSEYLLRNAESDIIADRFIVEIYSRPTGWVAVSRLLDFGHNGITVIVPQTDPDQRIHLAVDEITAVRSTKRGDAAAPGHDR